MICVPQHQQIRELNQSYIDIQNCYELFNLLYYFIAK